MLLAQRLFGYAIRPALLLFLCVVLFGQSERGTIEGTVRDSSGAIVIGARILVTNTATNSTLTITSNQTGEFSALSLPAGQYNVRAEKEGFRPSLLTGITLNAATNVRADMTLEVGASTQIVEVKAAAVQLQTEDAKTSVTVNNKMVDELPLVVSGALRSPFDLASLTPEAKNLGGDNGFMLGGGQAASYGTSLDGISTNTTRALSMSWVSSNAPSLEAITEFTVDTNGFKAEYGHSGGGIMTFSSKSGTNALHGTAYDFLRNNDLDANNWFQNRAGKPIPIYKQNDFGFSAGGPVFIPKVYHGKNKTFWFFAYEGFRNRQGATGSTFTVPTAEMYNGDFSKWVDATGKQIPIYNPNTQVISSNGTVTRQQFAGNIIPKSLFDPFSVQALGVFASGKGGQIVPNNGAAPGTAAYVNNNYLVSNGSQVSPVNKWSVKGDHVFSEKDRISGYYGYNRQSMEPGADGPATLPGLYTNYNDLRQFSDVVRFSWDHTFSPTKLNHFYAGGNNWRQLHDPPQATVVSGVNWKDKICLGNVPDCSQNLVNLFTSNNQYSMWGGNANNGSENTIYAYNDDFTWIKGNHTFKFGGMYQLSHYNGLGRQCISGCASFSYVETGRGNDTNFATSGGNSFASFLLGQADGGQIDTVRFIGQQWPYFAGYFQDDWRYSRKLVFNLGLRWETTLPPTGLDDKWSDFSPTTINPRDGIPGALIFAGSGPGRVGTRSLADSYFKDFGPHLGFAYNYNEKTVIRGSYALAYAAITTVSGSSHQRGFTQTYSPPGGTGTSPSFILSQGFPSYPIPPFIDPSFSNKDNMPWFQGQEATKAPSTNNFNLSVQRQLDSSSLVEVSYSGVMGAHLQSQLLGYNQVPTAYYAKLGTAVLNSLIGSAAANAAGIGAPYPNFVNEWGGSATVKQALRPFPQYQAIDTYSGGGDHSGHSTYHAGIIRYQKQAAGGLSFQTSYVFSKILTDSDTYWGSGQAADQYNRRLEKSIGQFDITHNFKAALIYELPFGKGKRFMTSGVPAYLLGGWRISSIHYYSSGQPIALGTSYSIPLFAGRNVPYVTSYDGWRATTKGGSFDPSVDNFFVPYGTGPFPTQGTGTALNSIGNVTRYNPKVRQFPNLNENISLAKSFPIWESMRIEFRAEAFNVLNRVRFGTGSTTLQDQNFGHLTSAGDLLNSPRSMQMALKLYF
jgi:hypothetical protein